MSTILGPLADGLRILFKVDFDITNTALLYSIMIEDFLPKGIKWYSTDNSDNRNAVIFNDTRLDNQDYTIEDNGYVTLKIDKSISKINTAANLAAYIDTYVEDSSLIQPLTDIVNKADLTVTQGAALIYGTAAQNISFIKNNDIEYAAPPSAPPVTNQPLVNTLKFTASSSTDPDLVYKVTVDLGSNLVIDRTKLPPITGVYKDKSGNMIPLNIVTFGFAPVYEISIYNADYLSDAEITLFINTKTNYNDIPPAALDFKYKLAIGTADTAYKTQEIPDRNNFTLRKTVI